MAADLVTVSARLVLGGVECASAGFVGCRQPAVCRIGFPSTPPGSRLPALLPCHLPLQHHSTYRQYVLQKEAVDTVVHCAAQTHVEASFGNSLAFTLNNT